jgi:predicted enzyme related to lactoylglutathione lyase
MLNDALVVPTIPVTDLERAKPFYRDVLGLTVLEETPFSIRFGAGAGTQLSVFKRGPVERGHTVAHFEVADIEATLADIRSRGGVFEEYSGPGLTTVNGIAPIGPARGAWIKDPEGNVLGMRQGPIPGR